MAKDSLLSDYFLLSECPLLNACFHAVSCYKRMHLTSTYGSCLMICKNI